VESLVEVVSVQFQLKQNSMTCGRIMCNLRSLQPHSPAAGFARS
jgi:hypothetical protein